LIFLANPFFDCRKPRRDKMALPNSEGVSRRRAHRETPARFQRAGMLACGLLQNFLTPRILGWALIAILIELSATPNDHSNSDIVLNELCFA
jgi:hypothetical protein